MKPDDRDRFSQFVEELAAALHDKDRLLSIAVFPKDAEPGKWHTQKAADYARLGAAVDEFKVMTYSYSGGWSDPGPQTPLAWARKVLTFAASQVPPEKVLMGVPFYGFDWHGESTTAVFWEDADATLSETDAAVARHDASGEATFTYTDADEVLHTVWFQDRKAWRPRRATSGASCDLAGIAIWQMHREDPRFWTTIRKELRAGSSRWPPPADVPPTPPWGIPGGHAEPPRPRDQPIPAAARENPVDWFPWGPEALGKARAEDKPIFLSIGYAACHWCHVMERESFEDEATAAFLNEHFVAIKVDREERPDLDAIYMDAVVALTGQGGWPMSVFLTPDGVPVFGGTYCPKEARYGMPAFRQVLEAIATAWRDEREKLRGSAEQLRAALRRPRAPSRGAAASDAATASDAAAVLSPESLEKARAYLGRAFDRLNGGFAARRSPAADGARVNC